MHHILTPLTAATYMGLRNINVIFDMLQATGGETKLMSLDSKQKLASSRMSIRK